MQCPGDLVEVDHLLFRLTKRLGRLTILRSCSIGFLPADPEPYRLSPRAGRNQVWQVGQRHVSRRSRLRCRKRRCSHRSLHTVRSQACGRRRQRLAAPPTSQAREILASSGSVVQSGQDSTRNEQAVVVEMIAYEGEEVVRCEEGNASNDQVDIAASALRVTDRRMGDRRPIHAPVTTGTLRPPRWTCT